MKNPTSKEARTFLVTGASTGIGAACALRLDISGHRVFAGVRHSSDGQALEEKARGELTHLLLDVTDERSIAAAAKKVEEEVGGLAGLVNNAGIVLAGPLECLPLDELRRQFETNVIGTLAVTQRFLPLLRNGTSQPPVRSAGGRIVNMGSITGRLAPPFLGSYGASKHAIRALTDALRLELRPWRIHVALIEPGAVRTPIWEKSRDAAEALVSHYPQDTEQLYDSALDAMRTGMARMSRIAVSPERVAAAVEHALTAHRPKTRYLVGPDAHAQAFLARFAPDRLRDLLVRRVLGLPH